MSNILKQLLSPFGGKVRDRQEVSMPPVRMGKRQFRRYEVTMPVRARAGSRQLTGATCSMGLGGMFMACDTPFDADTTVNLTFAWDGPVPTRVETTGKVAYAEQGGMGIRFTGLAANDYKQLQMMFSRISAQARQSAAERREHGNKDQGQGNGCYRL